MTQPNKPQGYREIADSLLRRYAIATGQPEDAVLFAPDWLKVCRWLSSDVAGTVSVATWSLYRRTALSMVAVELPRHLPAVRQSLSTDIEHPPSLMERRDRGVTLEDFSRLRDWVQAKRLKHGLFALDWLRATILTGLRPIEWSDAAMHRYHSGWALHVITRKQRSPKDNQPTKLPMRTIPLLAYGQAEIDLIQGVLGSIRQRCADEPAFKALWKSLNNNVFGRASREGGTIDAKQITLYSGRHQFKRNLEHAGLPESEIAVLMGHSSGRPQHYYGNPASAQTDAVIRADPEELSAFLRRSDNQGG